MNAEKLKQRLAQHPQHEGAPKPAPAPEPEKALTPEEKAEKRGEKFKAPKFKPGEQDEAMTTAEGLTKAQKPGKTKQRPKSGVELEMERIRRARGG